MAKVKITGHASGTGILTVTAPNTSTDRTITLPDATGTLLNSDGSAANLTAIPAANITGTLPAISGASLTGFTASQMPAGSVIQVVQGTSETQLHSTSASDDLISQAITPTATSSSVLIHVTLYFGVHNPNGGISCFRDSTAVGATTTQYHSSVGSFWGADDFISRGGTSTHNNDYTILPLNWTFLDTGISTTSATTYKFSTSSYSEVSFNRAMNGTGSGNSRSTITLMEIAG